MSFQRGKLDQDKILTAAELVAEREGLEAVSMRKIAAELGCSAMSIYEYFTSRDDIMRHLMARLIKSYAISNHNETDPKQWLISTFLRIHQVFYDYPELMRAYFTEVAHHDNESMTVTEQCLVRFKTLGLKTEQAVAAFQSLLFFSAGLAMNDHMVSKVSKQKARSIKQVLSNQIRWRDYPMVLRSGISFLNYHIKHKTEQKIARLLDSLLAKP